MPVVIVCDEMITARNFLRGLKPRAKGGASQ
jgi:hypothetical protein